MDDLKLTDTDLIALSLGDSDYINNKSVIALLADSRFDPVRDKYDVYFTDDFYTEE